MLKEMHLVWKGRNQTSSMTGTQQANIKARAHTHTHTITTYIQNINMLEST